MKLKADSAIPQIAETYVKPDYIFNLRFSINLAESLIFGGINLVFD